MAIYKYNIKIKKLKDINQIFHIILKILIKKNLLFLIISPKYSMISE